MVAPSVSRLVPALGHEALSLLSAAEFSELDQALQAYLHQVTLRVIRDEVFADASEAQEIPEALPPNFRRRYHRTDGCGQEG